MTAMTPNVKQTEMFNTLPVTLNNIVVVLYQLKLLKQQLIYSTRKR